MINMLIFPNSLAHCMWTETQGPTREIFYFKWEIEQNQDFEHWILIQYHDKLSLIPKVQVITFFKSLIY